MNFLITKWKKWNLSIKIGYTALLISFFWLFLALILLGTAQFKPEDANKLATLDYVGNGFQMLSKHGVSSFFSSEWVTNARRHFNNEVFVSTPIVQMIFACIFLVILLPITTIICGMALIGGYFMRWLYT